MRGLVAVAAVGLVLTIPTPVPGWGLYGGPWEGASALIYVDAAAFPLGSPQAASLEESFQDWNAVPNCRFLWRTTLSTDGARFARNHSDHNSGVAFSNNLGGGVLGVTYSHDHGGRRHSADVLFAARVRWTYGTQPVRGRTSFASVARHEYGHAIGLQHERQRPAVMRPSIPSGRVYPLYEDDMNGARQRYRGPSRHVPGVVPISGQPDWQVTRLTVTPTTVRPGEQVTVTYEVTNRGNDTAASAPPRHYLLSPNPGVTPRDQLLLEAPARQRSYAPGDTLQGGPYQVQIPPGTSPGTYHLGILVDPADAQSEVDETNNAASTPLIVQDPSQPGAQVDWRVSSLTLQSAVVAVGGALNITYAVENAGTATGGSAPELRLYVSDNPTVTTRDTFVAGELGRAGVFSSGQGYRNIQSIGIISLAPGTYSTSARSDPDDRLAESREDNNVAEVPFEVR